MVTDALRDYIETNEPASLAAAGASYAVQDESVVKERPICIVEETGSSEHEVLRGVKELGLSVTIETNPEDTDADAAGTLADDLHDLIGDVATLQTYLDSQPNITCWDVRLGDQTNGADDGLRSVSLGMMVVAAAS